MSQTRSRKARQLALAEVGQSSPRWTSLPEECRRELVVLLVRLLRNEALAEEETSNEGLAEEETSDE